MPTYEYQCAKCRKSFEIFQSMKADPLDICPEDLCRMKKWGKGAVKRQIGTGAGLIFKGSGFYITDYRSDGYKEAAKKDSTAASTSEKKETPKSGGETKKTSAPEKGAKASKPSKD